MTLTIWRIAMQLTPYLGGRNPLWHIVFSYWDDAEGCGCWREGTAGRRWSRSSGPVPNA